MTQSWSRFLGIFLSWVLLVGPLPLSAIAQEIVANIPECDVQIIMEHSGESYVYFGKELGDIARFISKLSEFDNDENSPLRSLKKHITRGVSVAQYDAVIETLKYAEVFIQKNYTKLATPQNRHLLYEFDQVMQQVKSGALTVNAKSFALFDPLAENEHIDFNSKRSFSNIMQVKGLLSVNDELVQNITAVNLSVTDEWVSGTLSMNDGVVSNTLQFNDSTGKYIAFQAPTTVPTAYTLNLPSAVPVGGQILRVNELDPTILEWSIEGSSSIPSESRSIYVTKFGDDEAGDGSFEQPYASLGKAIDVANGLSSANNPIVIIVNAGVYVEDNSTGPLIVNVQGISIIGTSPTGVVVMPNTPANDLLLVNDSVQIANMTFTSAAAHATGISFAAGEMTVVRNVRFLGFLIGANCVGGATESYGFNDCLFVANGTAVNVDDTRVDLNNCFLFGAPTAAGPEANTGFAVTGANANFLLSGGFCGLFVTAAQIGGNATVTCTGASFRENSFDIVQDGSSHLTLSGCTFELTTTSSDVDLQVSGAGTIAEVIGCEFSGTNLASVTEGTAIQATDGALINLSGCIIHDYTTAIQVGISTDTLTTVLTAGSLIIRTCGSDIVQEGSTTLHINACTASSSKITINDPTNVELAFFDLDDNGALTIGSTADQDTVLLQAGTDGTNHPEIDYKTSLYSTKGIGFDNTISSNPSTWFALSNDNADFAAITTDRTKISGVRLVSDEGSSVGGTTALRGWDINKNSSSAELSFQYQNSDTVGQVAVSPFVIMQLDGLNNQLQLPSSATKIVFAGDTNLYRGGANILQTDDNFVVGTLTPSRAVITNSSNQLASSVVTSTELGYVSGVTSSIQAQLDSKVGQGGATMTGDLQIPAGSPDAPALSFTGSPTTGFSASSDDLAFSTAAVDRMNISPSGVVSIANLTPAGVVHNDASGNLSSSLIVNADVDPAAAIADSKLATISSAGKVANSATTATAANTANTIVLRDSSGNFSAGTITANLTGVASNATTAVSFSGSLAGDVTGTQNATVVSFVGGSTAANVNSATILANAATNSNAASAIVKRDANGTFSAGLISVTDEVISNSVAMTSFSLAGVVHNDANGLLSSSLIVNADIDPAATIADSKLATISTAGKVSNSATTATSADTANAIVARDGSGNFSAGTITANLTGVASNATTAVSFSGPLAGDVTGTQGATVVSMVGGQTAANVAAGAVLANAATNLNTPNAIVERDANGAFAAGVVSVTDGVVSNSLTMIPFNAAGVVHNNASGVLSSSLIVNADLDPSAAIADSKLATISSAGKVANSATTATSSNVANAIVARDASGNFSAGTITANLSGNASTSTNFTGSLSGDVTGVQDDTVVSMVGGQTAAAVAAATVVVDAATNLNTPSTLVERDANGAFAAGVVSVTDGVVSNSLTMTPFNAAGVVHNNASGVLSSSLILNNDITDGTISNAKLAAVSSANTPGSLVVRDGSGDFEANMITLFGTVTNPTDVATKAYVDTAVTMGIIVKTPAVAVSTSDTPITGLYTIDSVALAANDRVLLVGQADATQNGLWLAASGAWSRPTDFAVGNEAGPSYVLISSGAVNEGSSYLCNTALAIIGTGSIGFELFTMPDVTTGANLGAGTGLVYQGKSGITLNFRSLLAGSHIQIANNTDDITLETDATSSNTPSTIVARDASGNFSAGTITANLAGNATTSTTATNFTGSFSGDVTGTQNATVVSFVGGQSAANVAAATVLANAATPANTANAIVERSATGGFSAGVVSVTDEVISNSLTITPFTSAGVLHNDASGDVSSSLIVNADLDPSAAIADSKLATISSAGKVANSATTATSSNTANAIVARDASGNFSAGTITASLNGNAATATSSVAFTGSLAGDVTGTQSATVVSFVGGRAASDVAAATVLVDAATNLNTPSTLVERDTTGAFAAGLISVTDEVISNSITMTPFSSAGVVHNNASGLFSSSLIVNADVDPAAAIVDSKLATISSAGKVANSATTATAVNTANTIVLRDGSGNFSAGTITANLTGLATNATTAVCFSGSLFGDVTGTQGGTIVSFVGGQPAANIAAGAILANTATDNNVACAIVRRDPNGAFSAGLISVTDEVISNSVTMTPFSIAGIVHNDATGLLSSSLIVNADVDPAAAIADSKLATISTPGKVANSATTATSTNTSNTIVLRDGSGNFSAGTITANIVGSSSANVLKAGDTMTGALQLPAGTTALPALNFTGSPTTGLSASSDNLSFSTAATERMNIDNNGIVSIASLTPAGVVHNDASGNLSSSLIVNADVDPAAAIADSKLATISSAGKVANSATTATNLNNPNTIVSRDAFGNFVAGTISANLTGSASLNVLKAGDTMTGTLLLPAGTTPLPALAFTGSPTTGLSATTDDLSFSTAGTERMKIDSDGIVSIDGFIEAGVVHNDASGNLSSSLIVNADIDANAGIIDAKLATLSTPGKVANSATTATSSNTISTIVMRDASGDFSAGTVSLVDAIVENITISSLTPAGVVHNDASGNLSSSLIVNADVDPAAAIVDSKLATISSSGKVANSATSGTNLNTANTLVLRDGTGSFAAQIVSVVDAVASGNLVLGTNSTSSAGNILKGNSPFIHNFGISNTFVGVNAGNFTMTGLGLNTAVGANALTSNTTGNSNVALGYNALVSNTTGNNNIAIGYLAGQTITSGSGNIYINADAGSSSESGTIRIGTSQDTCYIAGINTSGLSGDGVVVDSNGQLGITLSSAQFKRNIQNMNVDSDIMMKLRPVTFEYKNDTTNAKQYGLIAEEVNEVFPAMVRKDLDDAPYTVRYHMLPVLLLNELQKQHRTIKQQQEMIENMKEDYVTKEEMNRALSILQAKIQEFVEKNIEHHA